MKKIVTDLPIVAGALLGVSWLVGPLYKCHDGYECGRQRIFFSFNECRLLRHIKVFVWIESPGDPNHQHRHWDAQWCAQYGLW